MTRERGALGACLRIGFAAAATTWAAMLSWRGFTDLSVRFLLALVVIGAIVALTGALGRWRRLPGLVTFPVQVVLASIVTCVYVADAPYPNSAFWDALRSAVDAANTYASPVPATGAIDVQPLLIVGGVVAILLVDLLACTLRRVPLAGLPLLAVYSVPVSLLESGLSWWVFGATALGFLIMLFLQEQEHVGRWGRSLDPSSAPSHRSEAVRVSALFVGAGAVALAVVAPLAVPTLSLSVFDFGAGSGGSDEIRIENPMVDLRRDLRRGEDSDLVTITTDDPSPDHLRISVLNRFSDNEFSSGDRDVPAANLADGALPALEGVGQLLLNEAKRYSYQVSIDDSFESLWLPTQAPISAIDAPGDWRFDESTMDFLSSKDDLSTAGLSYSMTALDYDFQESSLSNTSSLGAVSDEVIDLPAGLSPIIGQTARSVTAGTLTKYAQAVALQQWFREDGNFTYSLEDSPSGRVGSDQLVDFLDQDTGRVGYCEQFAAAMAVMARTLDIPSRVAVGFLKPDRVEGQDDTWVYSAHDLHAWPELYFPGAGWVLFDPTPSARVPDNELPAYTTRGSNITLPTVSQAPRETITPSGAPTNRDPSRPSVAPDQTSSQGSGADDGISIPWSRALGGLGLVGLLALLVLAPRSLRARQRTRRLAGGPESAWEELRATVVDLGLRWPDSRSPGEVEAIVVRRLGLPGDSDERPVHGPEVNPQATEALSRIVRQVERSRYARSSAGEPGALRDDVLTCCTALEAGAAPRARRRAIWLPRSVAQRRTVVEQAAAPQTESDLAGGLVEHI